MDNIAIEKEKITTFLGILINENISWEQHTNKVSTKISKSIGILYKSREIVQQLLLNGYIFLLFTVI